MKQHESHNDTTTAKITKKTTVALGVGLACGLGRGTGRTGCGNLLGGLRRLHWCHQRLRLQTRVLWRLRLRRLSLQLALLIHIRLDMARVKTNPKKHLAKQSLRDAFE